MSDTRARRYLGACLGLLLLAWPMAGSPAFFFQLQAEVPFLPDEMVSYRADSGANFEAVAADETGWISQTARPFQATEGPQRVWARFTLPAASAPHRVLIATGAWESAEYFVVREGRLVHHEMSGMLMPAARRTTKVSMTPASQFAGFVTADLAADAPTTVLVRVASDNRFLPATRLHFVVWDEALVREGESRDRLEQGVFLGVMLALVLYNLALLLQNPRERGQVHYLITLGTTCVVWGILYGLTDEMLWPNAPECDYYAIWVALPLVLWSFVEFMRGYLETRSRFPGSDAALKWIARAAVLMLVSFTLLFVAGHPPSGRLIVASGALATAVAAPVGLTVAVRAALGGQLLARLFLAGLACSFLGALITFGAWLEFLPETEWALNAAQVGAVAIGILLSMGQGFRMREIRGELAQLEIAEAQRQRQHERETRELAEAHSRDLETKVRERTAELSEMREKSDALLANILPRAVIEELKTRGSSEPRRHDEVSMLFTDFKGFTQATSTIPPRRLVQELDEIFRGFDDVVARHGLEKIKTIGDAYMAASGLPTAVEGHATHCVRAALELVRFIEERNRSAAMKWDVRVGVHSGAVVAGIVGKNKYAYDVWGDTVNIAARLESAGDANRVNISAYTYELVRGAFDCEYRGKLPAKGKGDIDMYFVLRERAMPAGSAA